MPSLLTVLILGHLVKVALWALLHLVLDSLMGSITRCTSRMRTTRRWAPESSSCRTTHRIRGTVEAAVGTLFFGWSTVRLHRAAGRPGDPGHGRRLRWRIVPIAARLGMTKALSHG